jgi:hypothetical protein
MVLLKDLDESTTLKKGEPADNYRKTHPASLM